MTVVAEILMDILNTSKQIAIIGKNEMLASYRKLKWMCICGDTENGCEEARPVLKDERNVDCNNSVE